MTTNTTATIADIREALEARKDRSAWDKGVTLYALELLDELAESIAGGYFDAEDLAAPKLLQKALLNGADNWSHYSYSGCALVYDADIAERLCSPSELKRCNGGDWAPNRSETWLDVQARALEQAAYRLRGAAKEAC